MAIPFPIGITFVDAFLDQSKDDARRLIRHEMESMLDPLIESLFKQLKDKFVDYVGDFDFHQRHQNAHDRADNGQMIRDDQPTISNAHQNQSLSKAPSMDANCQVNSTNHQPALMLIKQEINDHSNVQLEQHQNLLNSSSSSTHEPSLLLESMIPSNPTDQLLSNIEMQQQQHPHIKHTEFDVEYDDDDEECYCEECVDGGVEVKEEEDDEDDQIDQESSRPVKRPRMDTTQPNNAQAEMGSQSLRQPTDDDQWNDDRSNEVDDRIGSEQSEAIGTRTTIEHCSQDNSDESMVIQRGERDANNAIGEEIATECTNDQIQSNLTQPNRQIQFPHCHKSFISLSALHSHLRVHTGERPYQCGQCEKLFSEKGNLTRHQLIHQNIKRFQCHYCEKQFTLKQHLDTHEQAIHLHVKPYRCKVCGHSATKRSDVITHIRVVHFGLPPTIKQQRARNIVDHRDPRELVEKL